MPILRPAPIIAALALLSSVVPPANAAGDAMVAALAGRWSGWGSIVMSGGATEKVRCVVTYDVADDAAALRQVLRCASASYRVDADADLTVAGDIVSGRWSESNYAAEGSVAGRLSPAGMNVAIEGEHFSAAMALTASACRQAITIAPRGIDVVRVSIELSKC